MKPICHLVIRYQAVRDQKPQAIMKPGGQNNARGQWVVASLKQY
jgi:hypothetical protein